MSTNDEIKQVIYDMITENTGHHMLDSGGAYGRHWERNQKLSAEDFDNSPPVTFKAEIWGKDVKAIGELIGINIEDDPRLEFNVTKSLFHHLVNNLEYEPYIDRLWLTWDKLHPDLLYSESMELFYKAMLSHNARNDNYYPDDFDGDTFSGYTYNDENILSQDFVYHVMGDYVFIRSHNGCDARGGFSQPRLFKCDYIYETELLRYDRYTIGCDNGHYWDFVNAGYTEEYTETDIELNKCDFQEFETETDVKAFIENKLRPIPDGQLSMIYTVEQEKTLDIIPVCDGKAYCPVCGSELSAYTFDC